MNIWNDISSLRIKIKYETKHSCVIHKIIIIYIQNYNIKSYEIR